MFAYIVRRVLYAIPILIGVNLITFALFFVVNTPDDMARMQLGTKRVTPEAIDKWKAERGYDRPLLWNAKKENFAKITDTIFFDKSVRLAVELVTNGKPAEALREKITVKLFDLPDLIADVHGLCHAAPFTRTPDPHNGCPATRSARQGSSNRPGAS